MNVTIQSTNMNVTSAIEEFAHEKLDKLHRFLPNIASIRADISKQNNSRGRDIVAVQITVKHDRGAILRAEEKVEMGDGNAVKLAIQGAVDKMYSRIKRFKGKHEPKRGLRERFMATEAELATAEDVPSIEDLEAPDAGWKVPQIIRHKVVGVVAMNEEEAAEQMELLGHDFFMFFNADNNQINVVYRRSNGGYGVLVPQIE